MLITWHCQSETAIVACLLSISLKPLFCKLLLFFFHSKPVPAAIPYEPVRLPYSFACIFFCLLNLFIVFLMSVLSWILLNFQMLVSASYSVFGIFQIQSILIRCGWTRSDHMLYNYRKTSPGLSLLTNDI